MAGERVPSSASTFTVDEVRQGRGPYGALLFSLAFCCLAPPTVQPAINSLARSKRGDRSSPGPPAPAGAMYDPPLVSSSRALLKRGRAVHAARHFSHAHACADTHRALAARRSAAHMPPAQSQRAAAAQHSIKHAASRASVQGEAVSRNSIWTHRTTNPSRNKQTGAVVRARPTRAGDGRERHAAAGAAGRAQRFLEHKGRRRRRRQRRRAAARVAGARAGAEEAGRGGGGGPAVARGAHARGRADEQRLDSVDAQQRRCARRRRRRRRQRRRRRGRRRRR